MTQANNVAIESSQINSSGVLQIAGGGTGLSTVGTSGYFLQSNGTGLQYAAVPATTPGGSNTQVQFNNSGSFGGSANFVWDGTNVGIGATSSGARLQVTKTGAASVIAVTSDTTNSGLSITDGTINGVLYSSGLGGIALYATSNHPMFFGTNNTTRVTINSVGNVGIGTTSPSYLLDVNGVIRNASGANGSPYTQQRITAYLDSSNWGYIAYGADAIMRLVSAKTSSGYALSIGMTSAYDNTGTYTETNTIGGTSGNITIKTAGGAIINSSGRPMVNQTGGILQVVSTNVTGTVTTSIPSGGNPGTFYAISGFSVSITPSSTSSKILIIIQGCGSSPSYSALFALQLRRSGTIVGASSGSGYNTASVGEQRASLDANSQNNFSWHYVDSPATTSAITYQVYVTNENSSSFVLNNSGGQSSGSVFSALSASNITAMEIAG